MAKIFRNNDIVATTISDNKLYIVSHSGTLASYDLKTWNYYGQYKLEEVIHLSYQEIVYF